MEETKYNEPHDVSFWGRFKYGFRNAFSPVVRLLVRLGVTPNQVTTVGFFITVGAAVLVGMDHLFWAAVAYVFAGIFDFLDGSVARLGGRETKFGAFFDSTLDRTSEGFMFAAIVYLFAADGHPVQAVFAVIALLGSLLVSYTRARAESLGAECKVGILTRVERILLLLVGLVFDILPYVIYVMVVLTAVTVVQRVVHTYGELRERT